MTWLQLIDMLEDAPLRLLRNEVTIYQHEKGVHRDFDVELFFCPAWEGRYWEPEDGDMLQIRLTEFHYEHGNKVPGPKED